MVSDRDIDRLYQLPLGEFTGVRNAMAKAAGKSGAAIKALEKPSVPAWAVNQLYWRHRRAYEKLNRVSERVRAGHAQALKGRKIDLATLELQHGAAVKDAADEVRAILARAGDPATPATMKSVIDTLQALPGGGEPGRLTKSLAPIGFGAFGALMKGAASSKALAEVVTFAPSKPKPNEVAEVAQRADDAARKRLRQLEAQSKRTAAALKAARVKFERADAIRAAADAKLQDATAEANRLRAEVSRLEREARTQNLERENLAPRHPGRR